MMTLLAGVFTGFALFVGAMFGGHASTTPSTMPREYMHAATTSPTTMQHGQMMASSTMRMRAAPGIVGKVSSVSGTTIIISGRSQLGESATSTYSVDASNARIISLHAGTASSSAISISGIHNEDTVLVIGTVTGNSIAAKTVVDGFPTKPVGHMIPLTAKPPMRQASNSNTTN